MATLESPGMDARIGDTETEVLQSARWQYCGEHDDRQKTVLVQFSNGKLQNPGNMRFTLYNSTDLVNPWQRRHQILAAETDRLSYVGNNFGTGALKCNTLCRHFVGILNKTSGQMEVCDAEVFNTQPLFAEDALENQNKTFKDKLDSCIEAFGSTKQKRSLNSRRMNKVGRESLNLTVAKAAESIIGTKGVSALVSDAMQDDLQNDSLYLPPATLMQPSPQTCTDLKTPCPRLSMMLLKAHLKPSERSHLKTY